LQEDINEKLDNITEIISSFEETLGAITEAVEAIQGAADAIAADTTALLISVDAVAGEFTLFVLSFEEFAFGLPLIGGPFPDLASDVEVIIEFLKVYPVGGITDFEKGVQIGVSEALDTEFTINETVYDSVYHIISLIHENTDTQLTKLETVITKLTEANAIGDEQISINTQTNSTIGLLYTATRSIRDFFAGTFYDLTVDQRDTIYDIYVFLNTTFSF